MLFLTYHFTYGDRLFQLQLNYLIAPNLFLVFQSCGLILKMYLLSWKSGPAIMEISTCYQENIERYNKIIFFLCVGIKEAKDNKNKQTGKNAMGKNPLNGVVLYVLVMSRTCFRVNPHSIVAWMWRNSLLKPDGRWHLKVKWRQLDSNPKPHTS